MQQSIYTYVNEYNRKHALSLCWIIMQTTYSMCLTKWFRHSEWFSNLVWWGNFATNQKASCKRARFVRSQVSNSSRSFTHVSFGTSVRSLIRFFLSFVFSRAVAPLSDIFNEVYYKYSKESRWHSDHIINMKCFLSHTNPTWQKCYQRWTQNTDFIKVQPMQMDISCLIRR